MVTFESNDVSYFNNKLIIRTELKNVEFLFSICMSILKKLKKS